MNNKKELKNALEIAKKAHGDQIRSFGDDLGLNYFDSHVLRVVNRVKNEDAKPTAALHDVAEDTSVDIYELMSYSRGEHPILNDTTIKAVTLLTKSEDEHYTDYIDIICSNAELEGEWAREVKLADLIDNMMSTPSLDLYRKYVKALNKITSAIISNDL